MSMGLSRIQAAKYMIEQTILWTEHVRRSLH